MSHRARRDQVLAAERRLNRYLQESAGHGEAIVITLRQSFTPLRLLLGGLAAGVLVGWLRPLHHAAAVPRALHLLGVTPTLLGALAPWFERLRSRAPTRPETDDTGPRTDTMP